jgi:hypothetical protein
VSTKRRSFAALVAAAGLVSTQVCAQTTGPAAQVVSGIDDVRFASQVLPVGTPVRLMNLVEVNSRTAIVGHYFKLRVIEPVFVNGKVVVPVGATAWGEVVSFSSSGAVGKGGRLGVRIAYLDLPEGRLPLTGELSQKGNGNGAGVAFAVIGFGLLGLLTTGDSARFKGGEQITAYVGTANGVAESLEKKPDDMVPVEIPSSPDSSPSEEAKAG